MYNSHFFPSHTGPSSWALCQIAKPETQEGCMKSCPHEHLSLAQPLYRKKKEAAEELLAARLGPKLALELPAGRTNFTYQASFPMVCSQNLAPICLTSDVISSIMGRAGRGMAGSCCWKGLNSLPVSWCAENSVLLVWVSQQVLHWEQNFVICSAPV